jgi:tetratricopeptide (TPR) repeat protein
MSARAPSSLGVGLSRPRALGVLVAICALHLCVFARSVSFDWVWDDLATLRDSKEFDRPLRETLFEGQHARMDAETVQLRGVAPAHESFRPLVFLSHRAEVRLFGKSSAAMHVSELLLALASITLAYAIAARLFESRAHGLVVAGLFAFHPLHVEPFCYLSARADLLAGTLALLAFLLMLAMDDAQGRPRAPLTRALLGLAVAFAYVASLFAKEAGIGLPVALLAVALALGRARTYAPAIAASLLAAPLFLWLRGRALAHDGAAGAAVGGARAAIAGAVSLPGLTLRYLRIFLAPFDISVVRPDANATVWRVAGWLALALVLALVWLAPRRLGGRSLLLVRLGAAGLAFALLTVGPSAVVVEIMHVVADRYAFLPLLGFAIAACAAFEGLAGLGAQMPRLLAGGSVAWGALLLGHTAFVDVAAFRDERALFVRATEVEPESSAAHYGVGYLLAQQGHWPEAIVELQAAARLDPNNQRALNNLAVVYMNLGRLEEAERLLLRVLELGADVNYRAYFNLGVVRLQRGAPKSGCALIAHALDINPGYRRAREFFAANCAAPTPPR